MPSRPRTLASNRAWLARWDSQARTESPSRREVPITGDESMREMADWWACGSEIGSEKASEPFGWAMIDVTNSPPGPKQTSAVRDCSIASRAVVGVVGRSSK